MHCLRHHACDHAAFPANRAYCASPMHATAMRLAITLILALALSACASVTPEPAPSIPEAAVPATHTEANGDVITEYRLGGRLKVIKVVPFRGVTYYIYDRNGDGVVDGRDGNTGPLVYFRLFSW